MKVMYGYVQGTQGPKHYQAWFGIMVSYKWIPNTRMTPSTHAKVHHFTFYFLVWEWHVCWVT